MQDFSEMPEDLAYESSVDAVLEQMQGAVNSMTAWINNERPRATITPEMRRDSHPEADYHYWNWVEDAYNNGEISTLELRLRKENAEFPLELVGDIVASVLEYENQMEGAG